jgi:hypothetical protein
MAKSASTEPEIDVAAPDQATDAGEPIDEGMAGDDGSQQSLEQEMQSELESQGDGEDAAAEGSDAQPELADQAAAEPQAPTWTAFAQELGLQNVASDEDARQRLADAFSQREQDAKHYQEELSRASYLANQYLGLQSSPEFQAYIAQRGQPQVPAAPEQPKSWWQAPEVDLELAARYLTTVKDPMTGEDRQDWKPGTPQNLRDGYESLQAYRAKWADELVNNPKAAMDRVFDSEFRPRAESLWAEMREKERRAGFAQAVDQRDRDILYEMREVVDPYTGQKVNEVVRDPYTGQPRISQRGARIASYMERHRANGIEDPSVLYQYALRDEKLGAFEEWWRRQQSAGNGAAAPSAPAPPQPSAEDQMRSGAETKRRDAMLRGTGNAPSRRSQAAAADADDYNDNLSLEQNLRQEFQRQGIFN